MHRFIPIIGFSIVALLVIFTLFFYTNIYPSERMPTSDNNEVPLLIIEDIDLSTTTKEASTEKPKEEEVEIAVELEEEEESDMNVPIIVIEEVVFEPPPEPPAVAEFTPPIEESTNAEELTFGEINLDTREALVNIFCLTEKYHLNIAPISGSGTIIDKRGVILTNAHLAQYYILEDYPTDGFVNCLIRTGSPAKAMYKATLLYISPPWIEENANSLTLENPTGTGEHDFAFLLIDEALHNVTLPEFYEFIEPDTKESAIATDSEILVGAYPAGLLGAKIIQQSLYASTAITTAMELFTFDTDEGTLDVISLGGTVVAQQGSSGGAVVNKYGKMVGLISTSSWGETTGDRDLRAISMSHIERSLIENNDTTLEELLSGDIKKKAEEFNSFVAPALLQKLIDTF